jgi:hypothetical protein
MRSEFTLIQTAFDGVNGAIMIGATNGGSVNAYTLTPTTTITSYTTGLICEIVPTITNTGASTLTISSGSAKSLNSVANAALVAGDLVAGITYLAAYNGTNFVLLATTKNYIDLLVAAEATTRAANDTTEVNARIAAVSAEAVTRDANDTTEVNARIAAVSAEATTRAANDTTETNARIAADALLAPLASPALTGTPTAPTASGSTNTTQIATTAFVLAQVFTGALPGQSGNAGKYVTTDGSTASWALVFPVQTGNSGYFLTTNGTSTSWSQVYPTQTGQAGKYLTTDGTNSSWVTIISGAQGFVTQYQGVSAPPTFNSFSIALI